MDTMDDKEEPNKGTLELESPSEPPNDLESRCGLGSFSPAWLQRCASKKTFVVVYGLIGCSYFAASAYFIGTISTMEKRFKLSSKETGIISAGEDMAYVCCVLFIGYLGSRGGSNKAHWVATGAIMMAISYYINVIPHMLYGAGSDALLLVDSTAVGNLTFLESLSTTQLCQSSSGSKDCNEGGEMSVATILLFLSRIFDGLGNSTYWTLGIAYLDDNVLKTKAPFLIAIVGFVRMFGPTVGYLMASYTLNLFVDPWLQPAIGTDDPRWIGAWWLGWIPCGTMALIWGLVLFLFPTILPRAAMRLAAVKNRATVETSRSFKDFKDTIIRITKNPVNMFNTWSSTFMVLGFIGHWFFLPKYLESQFRQSAARASLVTGSVGIIFTGIGLLASGAIMSRFKPQARTLAAWNVMVELIEVGTRVVFMFIGCPVFDLHGEWTPENNWNLTMDCNNMCDCGPQGESSYSPVCSGDKMATFYSSCYAGCTSEAMINGTRTYLNCSCIGGKDNFATEGACPVDCTTNFMIFLFCECLVRFLSATGRAGNSLIQYRCVHPEDKGVSLGLNQLITSLFGFIPGPIIYGAILDSSCLIWGTTCGESGNCWLYNGLTLRYLLNGTAAGFLTIGVLLDVGVWYSVKGLQIYEEDHDRIDGEPPRLEEREPMTKETPT